MSIHARDDDELERTDKLPILDAETIASIEGSADRTIAMQVDRTILRERTQPLHVPHPHPDSLHTELTGIRGKIADLEGRLRASEEHNMELERQRHELLAQLSKQVESRGEMERAQLELKNAKNEVEALQARVAQQTKAAADIARLFAQQTSETRTLVTAVERREGDLQKIAADRALRDARIAELETSARESAAEVARLNAALDTHHVEMNRRLEEISQLEKRIAALLEEASANEGKNFALLNERQELKLALEERETSLKRVSAELADWRSRHVEAGQVVAELREGLSRRDQRVAELEAKLAQAEEQLDAQDDVLKQVTARAESLAEQLTDRDDEIIQLNREIEEHVGALASIRHDIERIEDPGAPREAAHDAYAQPTPVYALRSIEDPSVVYLLEGTNVSIGRSDDNDIPIKSTSISRYHARFLLGAEGVMLADLQSTNGCYVNGRPVTRQMLHNGDAVMIGKHRFRFSVSYATNSNANPS